MLNNLAKNIFIFPACLFISIINGYFFNYINEKYFHFSSGKTGLESFSTNMKFSIIIIIAPIVETLVFNYLPQFLLKKLNVTNTLLLILIPSLIFACFHTYHLVYAVMALVGGLILNWYYNFNKNIWVSFWSVVLLHSLYNLYGYIFVN